MRDDILDNLWEINDYFTARNLDVLISRFRNYLIYTTNLRLLQ